MAEYTEKKQFVVNPMAIEDSMYWMKAERIVEVVAGGAGSVSSLSSEEFKELDLGKDQELVALLFKLLFFANSGAIVVIVSLLGAFISSECKPDFLELVVYPLFLFVFGLILSLSAVGFAVCSAKHDNSLRWLRFEEKNIKEIALRLKKSSDMSGSSLISVLGAVAAFAEGSFFATQVFLNQL